MKRAIAILCIVCLGLVLFISGCTQQNNKGNEGSTTGKTLTMTAKELFNDTDLNISVNGFTMNFKSLEDGDTLILQDAITNISYNSTTNTTTVEFEWTNGIATNTLKPVFEGNITDSYKVGDQVKITEKIKKVTFTYQTAAFDMELFADQWESQDYFISNAGSSLGGLKPLPQSSIVKR